MELLESLLDKLKEPTAEVKELYDEDITSKVELKVTDLVFVKVADEGHQDYD